MRKMIESAIRLIDEVNSAVLMGNKDMLGYSHDALEQAISMLTSLESQLTNDEKRKLKIASTLVNYSHLKEGASCFTETTCIKVSLNVEDVSPQALISVVPTVLYTTL